MGTHKIRFLFTVASMMLIASGLFFFNVKASYATAPNPYWWLDNSTPPNFSQYDDYKYKNGHTWQGNSYSGTTTVDSYILSTNASYDGVAAVGPRWGDQGVGDVYLYFTPDASASREDEWQCTELVKRFLFLEYGSRSLGNTNGYQVVDNYSTTYPTMYKKVVNDSTNTTNQIYPKAGDILSYNQVGTDGGHTALVTSVTNQSGGSATVQLIEQNASASGIFSQTFSNWQFQNGRDNDPTDTGHTVEAWRTTTAAHLTWTNEGNMSYAQDDQQSVLLPDGKVLIAGGLNNGGTSTNHTQIFTDGTPGSWAAKANMNADRKFFIMQPVTVSGGGSRVLAAGGDADSPCSCVRNTAELYNESANTWTNTATNMNASRSFQASSILSDGRVLVTGGDSNTSNTGTLASTEIYDPVANTWTSKASMSTARESHMQVTFTDSSGNSKVMVIGGYKYGTGALKSTEIYDPSTDTWSAGPDMSYTRNWGGNNNPSNAIVLYDGRILVIGGDSTGTHSEVYNPSTNVWTTYTLPGTNFAWGGAATRLGSGANYKVMYAGNVYGNTAIEKVAMLFDPSANSWSTTTSMNYGHGNFTLVTLTSGNVLAAGGANTSSNQINNTEEYTP